jgi:hypothetical protein
MWTLFVTKAWHLEPHLMVYTAKYLNTYLYPWHKDPNILPQPLGKNSTKNSSIINYINLFFFLFPLSLASSFSLHFLFSYNFYFSPSLLCFSLVIISLWVCHLQCNQPGSVRVCVCARMCACECTNLFLLSLIENNLISGRNVLWFVMIHPFDNLAVNHAIPQD